MDNVIEGVVDDKNLVKELEGADIYKVSIFCIKTKVVQFQSRTQLVKRCFEHYLNGTACWMSQTRTCHVKLPILEMTKCKGDPNGWTMFWDQFRKDHVSDQLPKVDKFKYLKVYLIGKAAEVSSSLSITEANYDVTVELVKKRFGQEDFIINKHLTKLLKLKELASSNNVWGLRTLYDDVNAHVRNLEALGVKQGEYAVLLHTSLQTLLPKDIVLHYHQLQTPGHARSTSVPILLSFIKSEVKSHECTQAIKSKENSQDQCKV